MRELLWFYGFRLFHTFVHPQSTPLKLLRRGALLFVTPSDPRPVAHAPRPIPKRIWMYWAQGWEAVPVLVSLCRDSWRRRNPGWEVILLDKKNVREFVALSPELETKDIPHAAFSDIVRVHLLATHGGVWADATTFCSTPLDEWLPPLTGTGFFAFYKKKTTIASWVLAAEPGNELALRWKEYVDRYWRHAETPERYMWVHYLFEYLILLDGRSRAIWNATPRLSSDGPYAAQWCLRRKGDPQVCGELLSPQTAPVHKLDWKIEIPDTFSDALRRAL